MIVKKYIEIKHQHKLNVARMYVFSKSKTTKKVIIADTSNYPLLTSAIIYYYNTIQYLSLYHAI